MLAEYLGNRTHVFQPIGKCLRNPLKTFRDTGHIEPFDREDSNHTG